MGENNRVSLIALGSVRFDVRPEPTGDAILCFKMKTSRFPLNDAKRKFFNKRTRLPEQSFYGTQTHGKNVLLCSLVSRNNNNMTLTLTTRH